MPVCHTSVPGATSSTCWALGLGNNVGGGGHYYPHFPEEKMRQGDGPRALSCDVVGVGSARSVRGLLTLPSATSMLEHRCPLGLPLSGVPCAQPGFMAAGRRCVGQGVRRGGDRWTLSWTACRARGRGARHPPTPAPERHPCPVEHCVKGLPPPAPPVQIFTPGVLANATARSSLPPPLLEGQWLNIHRHLGLAQASGSFPLRQHMPPWRALCN